MKLQDQEITDFQEKILSWYEKNKRQLPWRELPYDSSLQERDPYKILLSEVMSQQTQLSRVIPKYEAWLKAFPTVESLARASTSEVLRFWSGLGYNRRALFLQKTAQAIVERGNWPRKVTELEKLPGIGKYTASAVACFAFNEQVAVVDTNVRKVILVTFVHGVICHCEELERRSNLDCHASLAMTEEELEDVAIQLLPKGSAYDWNQALMDYSGAMLKAHKIPLPKQSKLFGSDRYYRGQTIKLLLKEKHISFHALESFFLTQKAACDSERLQKILKGLEKEGFITRVGEAITLKES